jgi:hypothetical protein
MKVSESMSSNMVQRLTSIAALATVMAVGTTAVAADWGTEKGKFVFKGDVKPEKIVPNKDTEYCSKHELIDESVVVGDGGELANVFVYLNPGRGKKIDVHPDIKPAADPKVLDNKGCRFEPHAMTLWTADKFEIRNSDEGIGHNTNASMLFANPKFNEQVTGGAPIVKQFTKSESYPSKVACNVHPWMNAYVLIRDNPYMAVSAADGSFEIANVPAGKHDFAFWHEAKGNLKDLKVGKDKADRKGQLEIEVPAGKTVDLGVIEITPALLGK